VLVGSALSLVGVSMHEIEGTVPRPDDRADPLALLSERQRLIAIRFAGGMTYREIGDSLHIAPSTVRTHLAAIYRRLGIHRKAALVDLVIRNAIAVAARAHPATAVDGEGANGAEPARGLELPGEPSIAVLRFLNLTSDSDLQVDMDGLAKDVTTAMSRIRGLLVIARNSSFAHKSDHVNIKHIACELGAGYVVEGSLHRLSEGFRVTAQLIHGASGHHLWTDAYDVAGAAPDQAQDDIVRSIVASVQTQIALHEGAALRREAGAFQGTRELLKRAWTLVYQFTPQALDEATELAERALEQSPDCDRAHQVLAVALYSSTALGCAVDWRANVERAHRAAEQAIELFEADDYSHCVCDSS
jgi:TolB-like protein/DNA-binding CsgD family transcriptional regulator